MNFVCIIFEQGDGMLTWLSMEKEMVECNLKVFTIMVMAVILVMSSVAESGFSSIFILLVILCTVTVWSVISDICEIAGMHFMRYA